jgi:hypothetical protein
MNGFHCFLFLLLISSCSSKHNGPITNDRIEAYVKSQIENPLSFHLIKIQVVDTTMRSKWLQDQYTMDTAKISETILQNQIDVLARNFKSNEKVEKEKYEKIIDGNAQVYRDLAVYDSIQIIKHWQDEILYISYMVDFQAKNRNGMLARCSVLVNYFPKHGKFQIATQQPRTIGK